MKTTTKYDERALEITLPKKQRVDLARNFVRAVLSGVQPYADPNLHALSYVAARWILCDYAQAEPDDELLDEITSRLLRELDALYARGVACVKSQPDSPFLACLDPEDRCKLVSLFYEFEELLEAIATAVDSEDAPWLASILSN